MKQKKNNMDSFPFHLYKMKVYDINKLKDATVETTMKIYYVGKSPPKAPHQNILRMQA